jgi:hypothetical protein
VSSHSTAIRRGAPRGFEPLPPPVKRMACYSYSDPDLKALLPLDTVMCG